jgi:hypothetical protein
LDFGTILVDDFLYWNSSSSAKGIALKKERKKEKGKIKSQLTLLTIPIIQGKKQKMDKNRFLKGQNMK